MHSEQTYGLGPKYSVQVRTSLRSILSGKAPVVYFYIKKKTSSFLETHKYVKHSDSQHYMKRINYQLMKRQQLIIIRNAFQTTSIQLQKAMEFTAFPYDTYIASLYNNSPIRSTSSSSYSFEFKTYIVLTHESITTTLFFFLKKKSSLKFPSKHGTCHPFTSDFHFTISGQPRGRPDFQF